MRLALVALFSLSLTACGGDDDPTPTPDADNGGTADAAAGPDAEPSSVQEVDCATVTIAATIDSTSFMFEPATLTISVGEVIEYTPGGGHNMTAGVPGAPTGEFATPTSTPVCLQFNSAGTFDYFCSIHTNMTGTVIVE